MKKIIILIVALLFAQPAFAGFWTGVVVGAVASSGKDTTIASQPVHFDNKVITCLWSPSKNKCHSHYTPDIVKEKLNNVTIVGYTFVPYGSEIMAVIHYEEIE